LRKGQDIAVQFPGLYLVHHNLPGKEVARHAHVEHLLFLPLQGEIAIDLDGMRLACGPGRMIYLPPSTQHAFTSAETQGERLICLIDKATWKRAEAGTHPPSLLAASQLGKELLFYLLLHPSTRHASSLIQTLLQTLSENLSASCHLLDIEHLEARVSDVRLRRALEHFRAHLEEPVAMETVAREAGMSVRSFNRLFLLELGLTPKQVLSQYRVARARQALLSGQATVTEAAYQVGYNSLAQFIAVFRQLTGQLPSEVARLGRHQ
jgi:AraC-like DNA-binding protein